MNKNELKKFVRKVLLEKLELTPRVQGKLVKKSIGFSGIIRECVCEGTVETANKYAQDNNLSYTISEDSYFGGHFLDDMTSYEFHPNPEFYGELMETSMTAREQLARICGTNNQILTEVDAQNVETLVEFINTDESFKNEYSNIVFEQIQKTIENKLYDKSQFRKMFEYLVKKSCESYKDAEISLSESEYEYAINLLSNKLFENRSVTEKTEEQKTKCGKKSFKTGSAFENMQRIVSGHQMFL
nr:hypothetical protein [uncultured Mediterranean phage uvMED]